ncbi:MAG: DUF4956 domain-containing protein [Oscillospiraceae bacterium]|jgi:hypothetical protein|nr:DUF4956 domain-containing protein [Oscillospiraceae bacterium]MBQ2143838.1 DUF4956 domain-containing protein [Oscillospiraceae bacterium]
MFDTIYTSAITAGQFFTMAAAALVSGLIYSWLMSFRIRSTKRFFLVTTLLPLVVAAVISFVSGSIGAGVAIGGAFGLIRFRSAPGSADEIAAVLIAMGSGIAFGMGYVAYGVIILLGLAALYFVIAALPIFEHRGLSAEKLLKVTIPESLEYNGAFDEIFDRYLRSVESVGVKTTGMGSMFRLSYRITMKNPGDEKALIDALRTKNGNLEISILPYALEVGQL